MHKQNQPRQTFSAKNIFIVTNDMFLYLGLRTTIPNLLLIKPDEQLSSFLEDFRTNQTLCFTHAVIFDNRITLKDFNRLMKSHFYSVNCVSSMLLDMQGKNCARLFVGERPKINAKSIHEIFLQINNSILNGLKINFKRTLTLYKISTNESKIISLLLTGLKLKEISHGLTISEKRLYNHRGRLHLRFGFSNFNEACLFIFRNRILSDPTFTRPDAM